jgi:hypothetical protein
LRCWRYAVYRLRCNARQSLPDENAADDGRDSRTERESNDLRTHHFPLPFLLLYDTSLEPAISIAQKHQASPLRRPPLRGPGWRDSEDLRTAWNAGSRQRYPRFQQILDYSGIMTESTTIIENMPESKGSGRIGNICVYCGSGAGMDPLYVVAARKFGRILAEAGIGLVYGGGDRGLMGAIAHEVLAHGGTVTGIIPEFLTEREGMVEEAQTHLIVPDMHTRKRLMFEHADAFVALPGGIGTLEELIEQLTWVQLGRHTKPVVIASINGFWRPLLALFEHMRANGFIRSSLEVHYLVAEKIEDVLPMIEAAFGNAGALGSPKTMLDDGL